MFMLLILHPFLRKVYEYIVYLKRDLSVVPVDPKTSSYQSQTSTADARLFQRVRFDVYFSLFFIIALHGISVLKILLILYTNYCLATKLPKEHVPLCTWVFNITILFTNELCRGYPFASLTSFIPPLQESDAPKSWGSLLDDYGGLIPRWEIFFKITILRLISFNMDFYWSSSKGGAIPLEVC